jgi:hypothetical protein
MRHMKSVELSDDEKLDFPTPIPMKKPDYPPGLIISLTEREGEKLDIDLTEAAVGDLVHIFAMARVISVHSHQDDKGSKCSKVCLQIEDMAFEDESTEEEPDEDEKD